MIKKNYLESRYNVTASIKFIMLMGAVVSTSLYSWKNRCYWHDLILINEITLSETKIKTEFDQYQENTLGMSNQHFEYLKTLNEKNRNSYIKKYNMQISNHPN